MVMKIAAKTTTKTAITRRTITHRRTSAVEAGATLTGAEEG